MGSGLGRHSEGRLMTATVTQLRQPPAYVNDGATIRDRHGVQISFVTADLLLIEHMRKAHEHLQAYRFGAALALVNRASDLLGARVAATEAALALQPTPPTAA